MAEVPRPVRRVLRDPVDEASFQRMWRAVGVRRTRSWHGRDRRAVWLVVPVAAAACAGVLVALSPSPERAAAPAAPAPEPITTRSADLSRITEAVRLEDGSRVVPSRQAALEVIESSRSRLGMRLDRGSARFEVEPGGSRRWTIDCGLAMVTVVGTIFEVERSEDRVRVAVERGVVRVDDRVSHRQVLLRAGDVVVIERAPPVAAAPEPVTPLPEPAARRPAVDPSWSSLAHDGEYHRAFALLGRDGLSREVRRAGPEELLALADVARLSGHPAEAVAPLERLLESHPSDGNAGLAAFTLGVLHMDQLGDPAAASRALERALSLGLPPSLQEDALGRLAIAHGRSGDSEGAARDATRYLERFPDGARRRQVGRWAP